MLPGILRENNFSMRPSGHTQLKKPCNVEIQACAYFFVFKGIRNYMCHSCEMNYRIVLAEENAATYLKHEFLLNNV
jgi:hypothetical protein